MTLQCQPPAALTGIILTTPGSVISSSSKNPLRETEKFVVAVGVGKACLGFLALQVSILASDYYKVVDKLVSVGMADS